MIFEHIDRNRQPALGWYLQKMDMAEDKIFCSKVIDFESMIDEMPRCINVRAGMSKQFNITGVAVLPLANARSYDYCWRLESCLHYRRFGIDWV